MDRPSAGGFLGLTGPSAPRVVVAAPPQFFMPPAAAKAENHTTTLGDFILRYGLSCLSQH